MPMRLAVMQPYFFPYIGYFQLVAAVDTFVFFNDVNFIKKGWINRNAILHHDQPQPFTIPLIKVSQNKKISETQVFNFAQWRKEFLEALTLNYKKAPQFTPAYDLISSVLFKYEAPMIDQLAAESVMAVSAFAGLKKEFLFSSAINYSGQGGQEKILDICKTLNAGTYINPKNGAHQYSREVFAQNGVELLFLEAVDAKYEQFGGTFQPWLSIIDVLMFNPAATVAEMVGKYNLLTEVPAS